MSIKDPSKRGKRSPMPKEAKEKQNKVINQSLDLTFPQHSKSSRR
jgi:hypothetical protein